MPKRKNIMSNFKEKNAKLRCSICNSSLCPDCAYVCESCYNSVCENCYVFCDGNYCDQKTCLSCVIIGGTLKYCPDCFEDEIPE